MNVMVKITVSKDIYQFYSGASAQIADCSAEEIMADALEVYAKLLSGEKSLEEDNPPA